MLSGEERASESRPATYSTWECFGLILIVLVFALVCDRLIKQGATQGQDFAQHAGATFGITHGDKAWFYQDATSRPLVYFIGSRFMNDFPGGPALAGASYVFVAMGVAALLFAYDSARRLIRSPALRLLALGFVALLPQNLIPTVVYSADAVVMIFFVAAGWALLNGLGARTERAAIGWAIGLLLALTIGNFAKATFLLLPFAVAAILIICALKRTVGLRRLVVLGIAGVAVPLAVGGGLSHAATRATASAVPRHTFDWHGTGEMTARSVLLPKLSDWRVLEAPPYFARYPDPAKPGEVILPLLVPNDYSYPALLHLSLYSDVLNYSKNSLGEIWVRGPAQQAAARRAVTGGLIFSLLGLAAVAVAWTRIFRGLAGFAAMPSEPVLVWSLFALVWFVPFVGVLPFVHHAYNWGYWLPRLVLPSIWVFFFGAFVLVDHLGRKHRGLVAAVLAILIAVQVANELLSMRYPLPLPAAVTKS